MDRRVPEQLDVPLVWEVEPAPPVAPRADDPFPENRPPPPAGAGWLLLAAAADAGILASLVGGGWALAALCGAQLKPLQLAAAGLLGGEVATILAVTCLFGWRGTPGMLLATLNFSVPATLPRSFGLWAAWAASLPLLGLPVIVGGRGRRAVERLAGGPVIRRARSAAA
jgi:hypothetical protein